MCAPLTADHCAKADTLQANRYLELSLAAVHPGFVAEHVPSMRTAPCRLVPVAQGLQTGNSVLGDTYPWFTLLCAVDSSFTPQVLQMASSCIPGIQCSEHGTGVPLSTVHLHLGLEHADKQLICSYECPAAVDVLCCAPSQPAKLSQLDWAACWQLACTTQRPSHELPPPNPQSITLLHIQLPGTSPPDFTGASNRACSGVCCAVEYGEHTEAAQRAMRQQEEMQAAAEARRRARAMVVPTDDREVRVWLRRLKEPVTLFGERAMERRERLRVLMTTLDDSQREELTTRVMQLELEQKAVQAERFFTEGGLGLLEFRKYVL